MKTTKVVTIKAVEAVPEHTKTVEVIVCDIDGEPAKGSEKYYRLTTCTVCGRHIHYGYGAKCSTNDPDEWGDYPDHYCNICYKLKFETYKKELEQLEDEYYEKRHNWDLRIKEESLATKI